MRSITTSILIISIFKRVLKDSTVCAFIKLLSLIDGGSSFEDILNSYSDFIALLYEKEESQNLYAHLKKVIYTDENILSRGCGSCMAENSRILNTALYELTLFDELLLNDYKKIKSILELKFPKQTEIISHLPEFFVSNKSDFDLDDILNSYKKNGSGEFACCNAFKFTENREIKPIKYFEALSFADLKNYDYQKKVIKQNTLAFLRGKNANNILLYGDRGCGKSSTVKALINEFKDYNLKIIQVYKESFIYLADLYDKLRGNPLKFIIFADDISFEENDRNFSSIKAVLEGSLQDKPSNTIIYATTNRMHLVKENFSLREGNDIHRNDTMDETISLSDRFGIMLTFSLLTKKEYLEIVAKIAADCCIKADEELFKKAEEFAALKSIRTPRTARQFITDYSASCND